MCHLIGGIPLRLASREEEEFFRLRPSVAGLAADDNSVVINYSATLSVAQFEAVMLNEAARVFMRKYGPRPNFPLTPEQETTFAGYGTLQDIRETVVARLLSKDPSAGQPSVEQELFASKLLAAMLSYSS